MRNPLSGFDLLDRGPDISQQCNLFYHVLIPSDVEKHGSGVSALRENQRPATRPDVLDEVSGIGSEFRDGFDIAVEFRLAHGVSIVRLIVQQGNSDHAEAKSTWPVAQSEP
jgi:hypothetical protein